MNRLLVLLFLAIILTGCSRASQDYHDAAVIMAEDTCDGIITMAEGRQYYLLTSSDNINNKYYYDYTCVTDDGSLKMKIKFSEIPVKYFKEKHNEF